MKWLITGGLGFVGINLAKHLYNGGHDVIVLDNFTRLGAEHNLMFASRRMPGLTVVRGDIRNWSDLEHLWAAHAPFDAVVHAAGQVSMIESIADPRLDFEINALGTFQVCEMVRKYSPRAVLVYTSTNKVYGDLTDTRVLEEETRWRFAALEHGIDESRPIRLRGPYSCSKGAGDQYVHDYHAIFGLRTVVLRMSTIYGPRQFATESQGWVSWFIDKSLAGEPFTISGDGKQVRDILHVDDLCRAFELAVHKREAWGGVFNLGGGPLNSLSILELIDILEKKIARALRYQNLPPRPADQKVYLSDTRAFRRATGWQPKIPVPEGIDAQMTWIKECALISVNKPVQP